MATRSCFGELGGIAQLSQRVNERTSTAPPGSYTQKLLTNDGLLAAKVVEEAHELVDATTGPEVAAEAADLLYFTLATLARHGVALTDVVRILDSRARKVTRRPGLAKTMEVSP